MRVVGIFMDWDAAWTCEFMGRIADRETFTGRSPPWRVYRGVKPLIALLAFALLEMPVSAHLRMACGAPPKVVQGARSRVIRIDGMDAKKVEAMLTELLNPCGGFQIAADSEANFIFVTGDDAQLDLVEDLIGLLERIPKTV